MPFPLLPPYPSDVTLTAGISKSVLVVVLLLALTSSENGEGQDPS